MNWLEAIPELPKLAAGGHHAMGADTDSASDRVRERRHSGGESVKIERKVRHRGRGNGVDRVNVIPLYRWNLIYAIGNTTRIHVTVMARTDVEAKLRVTRDRGLLGLPIALERMDRRPATYP